jgi:hypothetical protein
MIEAATEAVCCHNTDTRTKIEEEADECEDYCDDAGDLLAGALYPWELERFLRREQI